MTTTRINHKNCNHAETSAANRQCRADRQFATRTVGNMGSLTPAEVSGKVSSMNTTRINHTGHAHANTTAARTACRKAMKTAPVAVELVPVAMVGRGNAVHAATLGTDGSLYGVDCGAGMSRSASRGTSSFRRLADAPATAITCAKCAKH